MKLLRAFAIGAAAGYALGSGKLGELVAKVTAARSSTPLPLDAGRPVTRPADLVDTDLVSPAAAGRIG